MSDLKNCPFCDRQPLMSSVGHWCRIECVASNCGASVFVMHDTREVAVAAWNQRPAEDRLNAVQDDLIAAVGAAFIRGTRLRSGTGEDGQ